MLLAWIPGEIRCDGHVVTATPTRRPWTTLTWPTQTTLNPVTYSFDIDAAGRTTDIKRNAPSPSLFDNDDIGPSLAATPFPSGQPQRACTVTYLARQTTIAATPISDLISYSITPLSGALPPDGWARIGGTGGCADAPRPDPLVRAYPAFDTLPATPGVKDWSLVGYDLDPRGHPIDVHPVEGTGNAELTAAAVKAVAASRFTDGARRGCLYPYWRAPATLVAPAMPHAAAFRPDGATCPEGHDWVTRPTLRYPDPYRRRSVEGWAILVYDVAPWGAVGNIRVVAAQPAEDFGTAAVNVLQGAKMPDGQGLVGCVERIRFKMPSVAGNGQPK
ncbi:energy transducer TonB [Sphingomonas oligophenolica]|uniref:Energy transducer TonB n=2 Tax=Sphingomonas oligophenolica TaxID=301154 RepID=A0A502CAJ1_9SPHN|nr:energy transducer TonB [Sphingomonas oligophenolica]